MDKIRLYWPGRLHPGDEVCYEGELCRVAGYVDRDKCGQVPAGCVPIIYCHAGQSGIAMVPLDDLEVEKRH